MSIKNGDNVGPESLSAKDDQSFAYFTVKDRLPVILTKIVDLLYRERNIIASTYGEASRDENKEIVGRLSKLRNELQTNKPLLPITSKCHDVTFWNSYYDRYVETEGKLPYWFEAPWLYVECYLYRRLREVFELSTLLHNFDPFREQKETSLFASMGAVSTLTNYLDSVMKSKKLFSLVSKKENFLKLLQVALWGNKCDLSISAGEKNAQIESPITQLETLKDNILVNHSEEIWSILQSANSKHPGCVILHLVLDNAGFELFTDFCLVHYLQEVGMISKVHFFVKEMPWFVSDTIASDFDWSLRYLSRYEPSAAVSDLASRWSQRVDNGEWVVESEPFWTLPYDYSEMATFGAGLYKKLATAHLVLFKGDLNYRKLTGDRKWDPTTPFATSLCGFAPAPLAILRTLKANVVVGLEPGQAEKIEELQSNWMVSGDFAVIQCTS